MPSAQGAVAIAASTEHVRDVLTDFARYPEFVPDMTAATVLRAAAGEWTVQFRVSVVRPIEYILRLWLEPPAASCEVVLRWALVEGAVFRANDGCWTLTPSTGGTLANYQVSVELALFMPRSLLRLLTGKSLPRMLDAVRAAAERDNSGQPPRTG
jgi:ribosome-associated toxin RatA of RatAB toxin-antitoxin module